MTKSIVDVSFKLEQIDKEQKSGQKRGGRKAGQAKGDGIGIDSERYDQIVKETSKISVECNHGMFVEALKKFMFAGKDV